MVASIALALTIGLGAIAPSAAQEACMSNRDLYDAIQSGQIPPVTQVATAAGVDPNDITSAQLCDEGGQQVYVIRTGKTSGNGRTLVLPALSQ